MKNFLKTILNEIYEEQNKPDLIKECTIAAVRINNVVFTPPRRFENKGLIYMTKLFLGSFFNHKNKNYFTKDQNYWK